MAPVLKINSHASLDLQAGFSLPKSLQTPAPPGNSATLWTHLLQRTPTVTMKASAILSLLPLAIAAPAGLGKREGGPAPVLQARDGTPIAGKYIVKMKDQADRMSISSATEMFSGEADQVWNEGFKGFAASLQESELEELRQHPNVCLPLRASNPLQKTAPLTPLIGRVHRAGRRRDHQRHHDPVRRHLGHHSYLSQEPHGHWLRLRHLGW